MTKEDLKRIEEIRNRALAFKHWYTVLPKEQPGLYEDTQGPDMEFLLAQLDEAREELRKIAYIEYQKPSKEPRWTLTVVTEMAHKALGEE
jgi:hypothetical protein